MSIARKALLWISENKKLRETLPRLSFIRRAVRRFMPGEELEDALRAAETLASGSIKTIFTRLGENVADAGEASAVVDHYCDSLKQINERGLDTFISLKPTQLGLDLGEELCYQNLERIVRKAGEFENWVWIDMEQSGYVDRTLRLYARIKPSYPRVGLCLQSYLHRTEKDLQELLPLTPAIRLVKGAYREPSNVAFPKKADVDKSFFDLSKTLLKQIPQGVTFGVATHDRVLIRRIQEEAERLGLSREQYEYQLLYGIEAEEQKRLAREGYRIRSLISYGSYWFPWYVRRLAERPANVLFVLKNVFRR